MKKAVFMSFVALATVVVAAGSVFAQQPTLDKLNLVPVGTTGYEARVLDKNVSGAVVIPGVYNNKPVTRVARDGFRECPGITSVVIPHNVTIIMYRAFWNGSGLTDVAIPASVTKIEDGGFGSCNNLTSVTFLGGTLDMPAGNNNVFPGDLVLAYQAGGAGTYTRPPRGGNWTKQGGGSAAGYAATEQPASAVYYSNVGRGQQAPAPAPIQQVSYSSDAAYDGQPTLDKLNLIPVGTTGYEARVRDKNVSGAVVIPGVYNNKPVTRIARDGFRECPGITDVVIPHNVTIILYRAFWNVSGLTAVAIPASVTKIEDGGFGSCNNLTSVTFLGSTLDMPAANNNVFPGDLVLAYQAGGAGTYTRPARGGNWRKQ